MNIIVSMSKLLQCKKYILIDAIVCGCKLL